MNAPRRLATGLALLLIAGCTDARSIAAPASPVGSAASPAHRVDASGHFDANVDFTTLRLTPRGRNCLIDVDGQLVFTGTIVGVATAHTQALVSATCAQVASAPPGTYPDVFHSKLSFTGTVDGVPTQADGMYAGRSQPGGAIDGRFVFSSGMAGELDVQARIAVGGTYEGAVVVH